MPAPKKAAKAVQKHEPDHKQPKHKAKKHDVVEPKHKQLKDLRRAYEHLGRAEALLSLLPPAVKTDVTTLIKLGQACLNDGHVKDTAHLLRASEHLAFASAVKAANRKNSVAAAVKHALEDEFAHLARKAAEHWDGGDERHQEVTDLYERTLQAAKLAFAKETYRPAMELIRAAEALAHVEKHGPDKLAPGEARLSLTA